MSLIKCPDCEQSISSNAKQCPHCGCAFQVCPECETILTGEHKNCPECGFQLVAEIVQPASDSETEGKRTLTQWYELSKFSSPFIKLITSNGFHITLRLISFTLAAIALIIAYQWGNPSDGEEAILALVKYKDTLKLCSILLVLGALLWTATSTIQYFNDHISVWNFEKLVNINNLNLSDLIDDEFKRGFRLGLKETIFVNRRNAILDSIRLLQYKKNVFIRVKVQRGAWIQGIGSLTFAALCCIFAVINTENYMQLRLVSGATFGFKQLEDIWLPIVAIILDFVLVAIAPGDPTNHRGWMEENLPQHMADYKYYIAEYNDRLSEHQDEQSNAFK